MLAKPIRLQKESLQKLSKALKDDKDQHFFIDDVSNLRMDQLYEIDKKDLYSIFIRNKKGDTHKKTELFTKIKFSIEYIDVVKKSFKDNIQDFMIRKQKDTDIYRTNIKSINDLINDCITKNIQQGISKGQDKFIGGIDDIISKWIKTPEYMDMYVAMACFVEPIRELCKQYPNDQRANAFLKPVMECVYAYHNIKELRLVNRRHFLLEARGLQTSLFKINTALQEFENM